MEKELCPRHLKPGTVADYGGHLNNHLLSAFGDKPLSWINVEDVQGFKARLLADGYASLTVKLLLRLLRQMLSHAVDWGQLRDNPARRVKDPSASKREMDFLTPDEVRLLLNAVSARWYTFFLTAVTTELRLGELLAMRWGNQDQHGGRYFEK